MALWSDLVTAVHGDPFWEDYLVGTAERAPIEFAVHLGVYVEPFLGYLLEGRKTMESRFSRRRVAPYRQVQAGDVLLLKRSGGPITGLCRIAEAWFYHLDRISLSEIRTQYAAALCAQDPTFWETRRSASFATLMRVDQVRSIEPLSYAKRDRRCWVVLGTAPGSAWSAGPPQGTIQRPRGAGQRMYAAPEEASVVRPTGFAIGDD